MHTIVRRYDSVAGERPTNRVGADSTIVFSTLALALRPVEITLRFAEFKATLLSTPPCRPTLCSLPKRWRIGRALPLLVEVRGLAVAAGAYVRWNTKPVLAKGFFGFLFLVLLFVV